MGLIGGVVQKMSGVDHELGLAESGGHSGRVRGHANGIGCRDEDHADFGVAGVQDFLSDARQEQGPARRVQCITPELLIVGAVFFKALADPASGHPDIAADGAQGVDGPDGEMGFLMAVHAPAQQRGRGFLTQEGLGQKERLVHTHVATRA